jgi:nucleotide-binding universal stress UspA family protein
MFTSILCPVDFSEPSIHALDLAFALASREGGHVTLVHVAHPLLVEAAAAAYDLTFVKDDAERELKEILSAAARGSAPPHDIHVSVGDPASEILKCAIDRRADCIVMGTQGLSGFKKIFFGSVTDHVLRLSTVPVLAVPPKKASAGADNWIERIGRIMAPVDFSERSVADARVALELARRFSVPLLVLHVVSRIGVAMRWRETLAGHERMVTERARTSMDTFVASLGKDLPIETLVTTGSAADEIGAIAAERHVGLIVMGLVGSTGRLGARPGSVAYRVLALGSAPVLALPPRGV